MALSFPNSPSVGDVYEDSASGFSYQWSGEVWKSYRVEISDSLGGNLDADLTLNSNDITGTGDVDTTGNLKVSGIATATSFVGSLTGTASNATQLNSQAASYYLDYDNFSNTPTIPTNNNQLTNGAGFITTSFTNTNQLTNGAGFITASDDITGTSGGLTGSPNITVTDITASGDITVGGTLTYEDVSNVDSVGLITARTGVRVTTGGIEVSAGGLDVTGVTTSTSFVKSGGTSSQFLKADGSVDSSTYITSADGGNADQLDSQEGTYYLDYNNFTNTPTIPTNNNQLTNGAGFITSADGGNAATLDSIDSTQFLRSDSADIATATITFQSGADIHITSDIGNGGSTALTSMTGRLRFDNDYSDAARGPNKVQTYNDGSTWVSGFGVHTGTAAYYSGASHTWYKSNNQTSFSQTLTLDGSGNLTAAGQISGVTVGGSMIATQAEAEAGTNNDQIMTPLRVAQAIAALGGGTSVINSIQRGTTSFNTTSASTQNTTITSVDTTKSFISSSVRGNYVKAYYTNQGMFSGQGMATVQLTSATNVAVTNGSGFTGSFGVPSVSQSGTVSWEVIEFT